MTKLLRCSKCGKIFKIVNTEDVLTNEHINISGNTERVHILNHYTDFGDEIVETIYYNIGILPFEWSSSQIKCLNCGYISYPYIKNVDDWVADKVFTVKGEKNI